MTSLYEILRRILADFAIQNEIFHRFNYASPASGFFRLFIRRDNTFMKNELFWSKFYEVT